MNLKVRILNRIVRDAKTSRDHTETIPGAEEARGVAAYARVASADLARRVIGVTRPAHMLVSQPLPVCTVSPPQSPRLYARNGDVTALGLLSADVFECGVAITRCVTNSINPVVGIHAYRRKRVWGGYRRRTGVSSHPRLIRT